MSGLTTSSIGPQLKAPSTHHKKAKSKQRCFASAKSAFALPKDGLKTSKPRAYRRLVLPQATSEKGTAEFATEQAKNLYQQLVDNEYLNLLKDQSATPMDVFSLETSIVGDPHKKLQETPLENCLKKMSLDED